MKKIIVLLMIMFLLFSMAGCKKQGGNNNTNTNNSTGEKKEDPKEIIPEGNAQTFTKDDMTITLTKDFSEKAKDDTQAYYESARAILFCYQDTNEALKGAKLDPATLNLKDYAKRVIEVYNIKAEVVEKEGMFIFEFYDSGSGYEFYRMGAVQKGTNSFWVFEFVCEKKDEAEYSGQFLKWAKSITIK